MSLQVSASYPQNWNYNCVLLAYSAYFRIKHVILEVLTMWSSVTHICIV